MNDRAILAALEREDYQDVGTIEAEDVAPLNGWRLLDDVEILTLPDPEFLIAGVLPRKAVGVVYGPGGSGKTTIVGGLAVSLATGHDWFGHQICHRGASIYVGAEDPGGFKVRLRAAKQAARLPLDEAIGCYTFPEPIDLRDVTAVAKFSTFLARRFDVGDVPREVLIVDTYAASVPGASENSSEDTTLAMKGDAEALADGWRTAIREGMFRRRSETGSQQDPVSTTDVETLARFGEKYFERRGKPATKNDTACFGRLKAFQINGTPFGDKALSVITEDDVEVFLAALRAEGLAASTRNKYIQLVKALFRWATKKGYLARNPIAETETLKREKHAQRNRRLEPDEEAALRKHASVQLQRLIIGALETGMRRGELLGLTWRDVNLERREMTVRPENSKTRTGRVLPISARLAGILELANTDPAGQTFGPEKFVFGDVVGQRVNDIKRAWETCVLKAHGHKPAYTRTNALSEPSRQALEAIDLTFHDLRHEAGSRLLKAGWPLHNVSHMLGHANIAQTSTYLNATKVGLQDAMRRLDASRCNPVAKTAETDRPPVRNEGEAESARQLVN
jgi:integrase